MGRVPWVVMGAALLVGGITLAGIAVRGFSLLGGGAATLAVIVAGLILCGRLPGQTFFKDSSPTRAHDSLPYP
jgi:hypothetical protein